jgi:hypothetical protein
LLKQEITRIVRKELKSETELLKKANARNYVATAHAH